MTIQSVASISIPQLAGPGASSAPKAQPVEKFAQALGAEVQKVNETLIAADTTVNQLVESQGANIHETMIALDKADIAVRLTNKIGQKLVQAYKEISQMQV
jgi:flagellar hook-basal body complex protein FliE